MESEVTWRLSVMSDSSRPQGLYPARLLCPWDSPGKSTGVGYHFLLQGSSPLRDWTRVFGIVGRRFILWATRAAPTESAEVKHGDNFFPLHQFELEVLWWGPHRGQVLWSLLTAVSTRDSRSFCPQEASWPPVRLQWPSQPSTLSTLISVHPFYGYFCC